MCCDESNNNRVDLTERQQQDQEQEQQQQQEQQPADVLRRINQYGSSEAALPFVLPINQSIE